jgi:hypothetical protein
MRDDDDEQTWPTAAEMAGAAGADGRRLPSGTSAYQACWILDDEEDEGRRTPPPAASGAPAAAAAKGCEEDDAASGMDTDGGADDGPAGGWEGHSGGAGSDDMDGGHEDAAADPAEVARLRRERRRGAAEDDLEFPDERDTPHDVLARVRLPHGAALLARVAGASCERVWQQRQLLHYRFDGVPEPEPLVCTQRCSAGALTGALAERLPELRFAPPTITCLTQRRWRPACRSASGSSGA